MPAKPWQGYGSPDPKGDYVALCPLSVMTALGPHLGQTKFVHWMVKGSELPLRSDDALRRIAAKPL